MEESVLKTKMTKQDFLVDCAIFQRIGDRWNKYQLQVYSGDANPAIVVYRLFAHNLKRVNDEALHVEFRRGGIKFWTVLGSIYTYSRLYKFNEFELISTPTMEPSAQDAQSLQTSNVAPQ
jgi:hypothetical protein